MPLVRAKKGVGIGDSSRGIGNNRSFFDENRSFIDENRSGFDENRSGFGDSTWCYGLMVSWSMRQFLPSGTRRVVTRPEPLLYPLTVCL